VTFNPMSFPDSINTTSSPESAAGLSPFELRVGLTINRLPLGAAHASRFLLPENEKALLIRAIFGRSFSDSFKSENFQLSLENRLRARMAAFGSPEYELTWKTWDMPSGPPICALRASARRTSGSGFIGWPTPTCPVITNGHQAGNNRYVTGCVKALIGWSTPKASDCQGGRTTETEGGGNAHLDRQARMQLLGWATPRARDYKNNGVSIARAAKGVADSLDLQCKLVCRNGTEGPSPLSARMDTGAPPLNPAHSRWLMGYPSAWDDCGVTAMQSIRTSRRSSSKPLKKQDSV
jgi:hypothetical protein